MNSSDYRFGDEERRLMHLVPAPAVENWDTTLIHT